MNRLETLAPELVRRLKEASPAKQRAAAIAASEFAVESLQLRNSAVDDARKTLRATGALSVTEQEGLAALASTLDNEYLSLQEADEQSRQAGEALRKFSEARVVSAVLFASKADPFEASTEAIYEAVTALDDQQALLAKVESFL
jgi:hypothetical protein